LAGHNLLTDVHTCRRKIGFCPQFDALFELLTAREHLELYARIKGIAEKDIKRVVDAKIAEMGLTEYANRTAGGYSGGNKRKLSVAIAMIGEPSIVFLDEPSTGMDPVARRFMWEIISDIVTKREKCSVILTTHSMEECEALCSRIGIMVGGVLRCLGSAQRLRTRYGRGYQIEIGMVIPSPEDVAAQSAVIFTALGPNMPFAPEVQNGDIAISEEDVKRVMTALGREEWVTRLNVGGSGAELAASFAANGFVLIKHLAAWWLLEDTFDQICVFLGKTFGGFTLRELHNNRMRVEITATDGNGERRSLARMFGAVEGVKTSLKIQEYSIAQTTLEQIFNQFASQVLDEFTLYACFVVHLMLSFASSSCTPPYILTHLSHSKKRRLVLLLA
jgi:ATP-binding cassette, subfamily A (ABC1), member 3